MDTACTHPSYLRLDKQCKFLELENKVNPKLYLIILEQFREKINTIQEMESCLFWCKAKNKKIITVLRIRNWFLNAVNFKRKKELQEFTKEKDKVHTQDSIKIANENYEDFEENHV